MRQDFCISVVSLCLSSLVNTLVNTLVKSPSFLLCLLVYLCQMRFEAVLVALLAREAAARCKSVFPSNYPGASPSSPSPTAAVEYPEVTAPSADASSIESSYGVTSASSSRSPSKPPPPSGAVSSSSADQSSSSSYSSYSFADSSSVLAYRSSVGPFGTSSLSYSESSPVTVSSTLLSYSFAEASFVPIFSTSSSYSFSESSSVPVLSASSSYSFFATSSSSVPASSSTSSFFITDSSSSSFVPSSTSSSSSSSSPESTPCPTPADFAVATRSCGCSYDVLDRCDENTDCVSFTFQSHVCTTYGARVNEGVISVENASAKSGSLIVATCSGTCFNPGPAPWYEAPDVEDPSTCQTTFAQKPPSFVRTALESSTVTQTIAIIATITEARIVTPIQTTTTTVYTTLTNTVIDSQVTDTYTTTTTEYTTSTNFETTTDTATDTTTSTISVPATTTTIAAPVGFTPIKTALPNVVARTVRRVLAGRTVTSGCPVPTPISNAGDVQTYASVVACGINIQTTSTSTASILITVQTLTAPATTFTVTTTSTVTTVTTEVPTPAKTTITTATTETLQTTSYVPTTTTVTATKSTTLTVGPTPTAYAQCATNNMASKVNHQNINYLYGNTVDHGKVSSATDCCILCATSANCGGFGFTSTGKCYTAKNSGVCRGGNRAASFGSNPGISGAMVVGSGACGKVRN
ncbi:hypothetical protein F4811DRAFT_571508 [Daldinia bambusicola]|nr:hypothetical protein F4811DRAFT_571508 [Daldinia bambusicola]